MIYDASFLLMKTNPASNSTISGYIPPENLRTQVLRPLTFPADAYVAPTDEADLPGWKRFLHVPPPLRTWLANTMIHVGNILDFLAGIKEEDLTPEFQSNLKDLDLGWALEVIADDFQSPYLDNGSLSLLGLERIQNMLFKEKGGYIVRIDINMTDANKFDPSGNLGTAYKYIVLAWLQNEFGIREVSQNPEGTSFLVMDVPRYKISDSLGRFFREINILLSQRDIQEQYGFSPTHLKKFEPRFTAMFMQIKAGHLDIDGTLQTYEQTHDQGLIHDLQNKIIAHIEHSLRILAVGSSLAEKSEYPAKVGLSAVQSGLAVFNAADLPQLPGSPGYDDFQKYLNLGYGYVPAAVYRSALSGRPSLAPTELLARRPRLAHTYGLIDHREREDDAGGALQLLQKALALVTTADTPEKKGVAIEALKGAVGKFSQFLNIAEVARENPRNPALIKWMQRIELHDGTDRFEPYFLEAVAAIPEPTIHLMVVEIDSFKAFSATFPVDEVDSNFWNIFDQFFWVAKKLSIGTPIISQVGGDLIAVAMPTVDKSGQPVDLANYIRQVQERVFNLYSKRPFQDYAKVRLTNGNGTEKVERQRLWQSGRRIFPSQTKPEKAQPFMRTLSISAAGTTIPRPSTLNDKAKFFTIVGGLAGKVEQLKEETAPQKGAYRIVPADELLVPQQLTMFRIGPERQTMAGFYVPREEQMDNAVILAFKSSLDWQLTVVWGDSWTNLPNNVKDSILNRYVKTYQTAEGPFMPAPSVTASAVSQLMSATIAFPQASILIMPPTTPAMMMR